MDCITSIPENMSDQNAAFFGNLHTIDYNLSYLRPLIFFSATITLSKKSCAAKVLQHQKREGVKIFKINIRSVNKSSVFIGAFMHIRNTI